MVLPGVPYDWYPVDGGDGRACRGATSHDNQASYYSVVTGSGWEKELWDSMGCSGYPGGIYIVHIPKDREAKKLGTISQPCDKNRLKSFSSQVFVSSFRSEGGSVC